MNDAASVRNFSADNASVRNFTADNVTITSDAAINAITTNNLVVNENVAVTGYVGAGIAFVKNLQIGPASTQIGSADPSLIIGDTVLNESDLIKLLALIR